VLSDPGYSNSSNAATPSGIHEGKGIYPRYFYTLLLIKGKRRLYRLFYISL
jgi:hypothetical protein